ncbi:hypothetical protein [Burkholderia cepacia]|uniref:hypothetical protein n=1 Tax=Burkholderia cepacia TaxID=292 RepID=UPI000F5B5942|nr:hypothetical protein [Burkholderia cepacia]
MTSYELPTQMLPKWQANASESAEHFGMPCFAYPPTKSMSGAMLFMFTTEVGAEASPLDSDSFTRAVMHNSEEANSLASQWKALVLDPDAAVTAKALGRTVKPLFKALSQLGAGAVDLRQLPIDRVNGVHLAVVLRATLSFKERTLGWEEALDVARQALRRDGLNEADALMGVTK